MRPRPWWISFVLVLILNYILVQLFLPERPAQRIDVPYTFFKQQVVAGNVSEVTSRADVDAMVEALPQGRLEVLAGSGHLTAVEVPADFDAAVAAFLATLA